MSPMLEAVLWMLVGALSSNLMRELHRQYTHYHTMKDFYEEGQRKLHSCPHGHEDWDDCPDCCH